VELVALTIICYFGQLKNLYDDDDDDDDVAIIKNTEKWQKAGETLDHTDVYFAIDQGDLTNDCCCCCTCSGSTTIPALHAGKLFAPTATNVDGTTRIAC